MRLLNVGSRCLREFFDSDIPRYAILSHTWGEEEVLFQDIEKPNHKQKIGYTKIDRCCRLAEADGLDWVWADTCCINKDSSAELSEAINSMFRWYGNAHICYIYLSDVPPGEDFSSLDSAFRKSRWFTRGWTLQELLAPGSRNFYDSTWSLIGSIVIHIWGPYVGVLDSIVQEITGIDLDVLRHSRSLAKVIVAEKMSWASMRATSRMEDRAYCLLGILGVNMPLLYGEGNRAFLRLQEEVIRVTYDHSIFAWGLGNHQRSRSLYWHLFARHPDAFKHFTHTVSQVKTIPGSSHYSGTNLGLHIELLMVFLKDKPDIFRIRPQALRNHTSIALGLLDVSTKSGKEEGRIAMPLVLSEDHRRAARPPGSAPFIVPIAVSDRAKRVPIYLLEESPLEIKATAFLGFELYLPPGWRLSEYFPPSSIDLVEAFPPQPSYYMFSGHHFKKILIRYYHSDHGYLLLLVTQEKPDSVEAFYLSKWWFTIARDIERDRSVWQALLEPYYKKFRFGTLLETLHWGTVCEFSPTQRASLVPRGRTDSSLEIRMATG